MIRFHTADQTPQTPSEEPVPVTLLELVLALDELTEDETMTELLAHDLIDSNKVVLTGNFRGRSLH